MFRPTHHLRWHHTPWEPELMQLWVNDDATQWEWRAIESLQGNFKGEGPPPIHGDQPKREPSS